MMIMPEQLQETVASQPLAEQADPWLPELAITPCDTCSWEFAAQVCSYRCIVSHETPKLEDFTLCVLQRNNCLDLCAEIPEQPDPSPMTSWRGSTLTHESAEAVFIGWLGGRVRTSSPDPFWSRCHRLLGSDGWGVAVPSVCWSAVVSKRVSPGRSSEPSKRSET